MQVTKGLQLRRLGNVVTGEGERGESGSWRLDGLSVGGETDVCEASVTHNPLVLPYTIQSQRPHPTEHTHIHVGVGWGWGWRVVQGAGAPTEALLPVER